MTVKKFKTGVKEVSKPFIDFLLGKTMSKKLMIMILTYIALMKGFVTGDNWVWIACAYITVEGGRNWIGDLIKNNKGNFGGSNTNINVEQNIPPGNEDDL